LIAGEKNKGAYINNKRARVSRTKDLDKAYISIDGLKRFSQTVKSTTLIKIIQSVAATRGYANLGLVYLLEGKIDISIQPYGFIHDYAAPSLLVEEAGGKFTDFEGEFSLKPGSAIATNGLLHSQVLKLLNSNK